MTVQELTKLPNMETLALPDPDAEITGCYVGDLLSRVMGSAGAGNVWITIMSNVNVAAVAMLAGVSVVVLAENVEPDEALLTAASQRGVNLLRSREDAFRLCLRVAVCL